MNIITSPKNLSDVIGQDKIKENLSIQITAAKKRGELLEHLLFSGPFGSGKSTIAQVVANEMGVDLKVYDSRLLRSQSDLVDIFTNLKTGDILLFKQIEELRKKILENLYPTLEDFALDIILGKGLSAKQIRLKLLNLLLLVQPQTCQKLMKDLKKNMYTYSLEPYSNNNLSKMILLFAKQQEIIIDQDAVSILAEHSKGLPSEATKLLKYVYNFATARADGNISLDISKRALALKMDSGSGI